MAHTMSVARKQKYENTVQQMKTVIAPWYSVYTDVNGVPMPEKYDFIDFNRPWVYASSHLVKQCASSGQNCLVLLLNW